MPNGQQPTNIGLLIPRAPGLVAQFLPQLQYLLIENNRYSSEQLRQINNLVSTAIELEQPESQQALVDLIELLQAWLSDNQELQRTFAIWIRAVWLRRGRNHHLDLPEVQDLQELKMTLSKRLDQWAEAYKEEGLMQGIMQGIQKGLLKGRAEGQGKLLQRLLIHRFGPLPAERIAQIEQASSEQLQTWSLRVLDVASLEEVFAPC